METLDLNASKETRETVKESTQQLRETGKINEALELFLQVMLWDDEQGTIKGRMDVRGHIRICYSLLADNGIEPQVNRAKALQIANEAIEIGEADASINPASIAIQKVQLAGALKDMAVNATAAEQETLLNEALTRVNQALENLPGTEAHRAWPLNTKANIVFQLGNTQEALAIVEEGIQALNNGYAAELHNKDGQMKLDVWESGLLLTKATILNSLGTQEEALDSVNQALGISRRSGLEQRIRQADELIKIIEAGQE
ncbi:hypothetical protein KC980_01695 [candidate division WWE3 bacterium]|uniref:Tetratricopeptide repeat protein n=1 Tax=candidate division WWE3 bacterium TaxID=2053526 RepID=A0A955EB76_UNCKA|nr:hypothetical protein [candidate division WWE3 bacterium]